MTIIEAYNETMSVVKESRKSGVCVRMSRSFSEPKGTEPLPRNKWIHVCFTPKNKKQWELLLTKEAYLHELGIYFDTGAGFGQRDWELDWSFSCKG